MKIEVGCRDDQDDADKLANLDETKERVFRLQALPHANGNAESTSIVQQGRVFMKQFIQENALTTRSRALQQALCQGMWQGQSLCQKSQPQAPPQKAMVVHWERFLPQRQLQVLLVEDDDATRHIVSALLRKCSYEVTSASNGLLAWQTLVDKTTSVDLVLTEVVMPFLSGIGLLGRIMNHESLRHIPVIMMSSHDSMNIVFKCLSEGAVDFLVKPVRKNELKNLWQHVWRRCHSSCGSRSGSGSRTRTTSRRNGATNLSESGTSVDSEETSGELDVRGGCDDGSGIQSPWNKGALKADCSSKANQPDSNGFRISQGLQPAAKIEDNSSLKPMQCTKKCISNAAYVNLVASTHQDLGTSADFVGSIKDQKSNVERKFGDDGLLENHASSSSSSKDQLFDSSSPALDSSNILDFSLKQPCEVEDHPQEKGGGRGAIHSYVSAFARYNVRGNMKRSPANGTQIHDQIEFESSAICIPPNKNIASPIIGSEDATARILEPNTEAECLLQNCPPAKCGVQSREDSYLPPVPSAIKQARVSCEAYLVASPLVGQATEVKDCFGSYKQEFSYLHTDGCSQYHHHSHHYHHHHHIQHHYYHVAEGLTRPKTPQYDDQTVTDVRDGAPRCGSSSMATGVKGNLGLSGSSNGFGSNCCYAAVSVNRSATGSNNGSNADQSAAPVLPSGGNTIVKGQAEAGINSLPETSCAMGPNDNPIASWEVTLTNFKLKRKERSFERKVYHQSRKRSIEQ